MFLKVQGGYYTAIDFDFLAYVLRFVHRCYGNRCVTISPREPMFPCLDGAYALHVRLISIPLRVYKIFDRSYIKRSKWIS
jgi:hypothetical protein